MEYLGSNDHHLLLNPRLPNDVRRRYENAWRKWIEPLSEPQIGIATSGSSGDQGKLIAISQKAVFASARAVNEHFKSQRDDVWLKTLPTFHVGGLGIFARARLSGASVVESQVAKWEPGALHAELAASQVTLLSIVPTQLFDLVQLSLRAPPKLRAVIVGGGRLEAGLRERALELGWPIFASYGCTECCSQVATAPSVGSDLLIPLSHVEVRLDESLRIALKSEALLTGQITLLADRDEFQDPKQNGWFLTEDRAEWQGTSLKILGRLADFVKIGGEGVLMSRLEDRFESLRVEFHGVDAVVLAAADARLGTAVVLVTTASEELSEQLVIRFNDGVMPFERIRAVHRVPEIPRSPLGKVLRAQTLRLVGLESPASR